MEDFGGCKYLANMGTDDEFGDNFRNSDVLCNKTPINFSMEMPTSHRYLDPVFYAHNSIIDLLLSDKFTKGFHGLPHDFDKSIVNRWLQLYEEDVSEIFQED